jgi:hypothetical protein
MIHTIEVILLTLIYVCCWGFFRTGFDKVFSKLYEDDTYEGGVYRFNEFVKDKKYLPYWCDYCFSFWICIVLVWCFGFQNYIFLVAPCSSYLINEIAKRNG